MRRQMIFLAAIGCLLWGCAVTKAIYETSQNGPREAKGVSFPPYQGPKHKIQVVQIHIPVEDTKRYPELAEKHVGFGLSNILVETLFDTGRFTFLEEKEQLLKRLVELWKLSEYGIYVRTSEVPEPGLQAPDFLVYAEVFDFVACSPVERIGWANKNLTCVTSVGVQVRIANTVTGEYIPGSAEGKYVHTMNLSLFGDTRLAFDQSAVGKATLKATQYAVVKVLERFDRDAR